MSTGARDELLAGWTAGRLRRALAGVPDHLPVRVLVPAEPGGDVVAIQIVSDAAAVTLADVDVDPDRAARPSPRLWFELTCDFAGAGPLGTPLG